MTTPKGRCLSNDEIDRIVDEVSRELFKQLETLASMNGGKHE